MRAQVRVRNADGGTSAVPGSRSRSRAATARFPSAATDAWLVARQVARGIAQIAHLPWLRERGGGALRPALVSARRRQPRKAGHRMPRYTQLDAAGRRSVARAVSELPSETFERAHLTTAPA